MVSFIGMFTLVHPFATTWHFPSRGNEKFRGAFLLPPTELRWQGNLIHKEPQATENQVTCFPQGKVVAPVTKGGMHFLARRAVVKVFS